MVVLFGNSKVPVGSASISVNNIEMHPFMCRCQGLVSRGFAYLAKGLVPANAKMVVCNDAKILIAVSNAVNVDAAGWYEFTFSSPFLVRESHVYYLGNIPDGTINQYYSDLTSFNHYIDATNNYAVPTDPTDAAGGGSQRDCIYLVVADGGFGGFVPLVSLGVF